MYYLLHFTIELMAIMKVVVSFYGHGRGEWIEGRWIMDFAGLFHQTHAVMDNHHEPMLILSLSDHHILYSVNRSRQSPILPYSDLAKSIPPLS